MEYRVSQRIEMLKAHARSDPKYARMHREALILEREFEMALRDLPDEVQDAIWKYLFHCEDQSERLLELAMLEKYGWW